MVAGVEVSREVEEVLAAPGVAGRNRGFRKKPGFFVLSSGGAVGGQEGQVEGEVGGGLLVGVPEGGEEDGVAGGGFVAVKVGAEQGEWAEGNVQVMADAQFIRAGGLAGAGERDLPQRQFGCSGLTLFVQHREWGQGVTVKDGQHDVVNAGRRAGQGFDLVAVERVTARAPGGGGRVVGVATGPEGIQPAPA